MDKKQALDKDGVTKLWAKIKEKFLGRDETTPVITLTKNEYDNLSAEDKKKDVIYTITDEPTPASDPFKPDTDKVPVGTVISFMGTTAPEGYLACDGATYPIASYPKLASFIKEQFGSFDHFGSNGAGTFGVPDLRNLFLRGFHGEAEEQLSGDVGAKQEATEIPAISSLIGSETYSNIVISKDSIATNIIPSNCDTAVRKTKGFVFAGDEGVNWTDGYSAVSTFTSRPVNTAVLYCIKAVESIGYDANDYSLEEKRIGTWIDGKPLYRKVIQTTTPSNVGAAQTISTGYSSFDIISASGFFKDAVDSTVFTPAIHSNDVFGSIYISSTGNIRMVINSENYIDRTIYIILEYTKTTD